jgi:surfeit locus 1 family protein
VSGEAVGRLPWGFLAAALVGIAVLVGLGTWQLERLAWKEALIARMAARLTAEPVSLMAALGQRQAGADIGDLRVRTTGRFLPGPPLRVFAHIEGRVGWNLVHPFATAEGPVVLLDRGFVPDDLKEDVPPPQGDFEVTGFVRPAEPAPGYFTPDNDALGNRWYWYDLPAMAAASGIAPGAFAGVVVEAEPRPDAASPWPRPRRRDPSAIVNNHLQYALTWYALAIVLAIMAFLFAGGRRRPPDRRASNREDRA